MSGRRRWSEETGRLARGELVIVVAWRGASESGAPLESVRRHTPDDVPVLVLHEGSSSSEPPEGADAWVEEVAAMDRALLSYAADAGAADVLVVDGVRVGPGYLQGLRAAAGSDSTIATASAWCVPASEPAPADGADREARAAAESALRIRPRVSALDRRCVLLRRSALELLQHGAGMPAGLEEASELLLAAGLVHVVADEVWVTAPAPAHPPPAVERDLTDERGTLARTVTLGRASRDGLSVTIDARALTSATGGTQSYLAGLIRALSRAEGLALRAVVAPRDLTDQGRALLEGCDVEVVTYEQAVACVEPTDIVHRPQQVFVEGDLNLLRLLGRRIVIDHLDLIAYRNPAYHSDDADWRAYRRVTRLALASADRVLFFSEHARDDAVREDLIDARRCAIAGIGGDDGQAGEGADVAMTAPAGVDTGRTMLVCLGSDYGHKNRPFAIALLEALSRRHGWDGDLVLAGPHVEHGSTRDQERAMLERLPELRPRVRDVGRVDEAERAWLYANAAAIVYPSTYEGYGLVPFEAARSGTPCLFAAQTSLAEIAGQQATLVPWDPEASADAAVALLSAGPRREAHLDALRARAEATTWSEVVDRIQATYWEALRSPQRAASVRVGQELERESYIAHLGEDIEHLTRIAQEYQDALHDLERRVAGGLPLIDQGGLLTPAEQRGLMRIAARRGLHRVLLGPVGLLGRPSSRS